MNVLYFIAGGLMVLLTFFNAVQKGSQAKTADDGAALVIAFLINSGLTYLLFYAGFHL